MAQRGRLPLRWVLTGLIGFSVLMSLLGRPLAGPLRRAFGYLLVAPSDVGMYLSTSVQQRLHGLSGQPEDESSLQQLRQRDQFMRQEVIWLRQELSDAREDLRDLAKLPWEVIPARVVAYESLPYGDRRLVGRGSSSGAGDGDMVLTRRRLATDRAKAIDQELFVLGGSALVGKLGNTNAFTAELILLTDRQFRNGVIVSRDLANPRMIAGATAQEPLSPQNNVLLHSEAVGDGERGLLVRGIPARETVLPGDFVLTEVQGPSVPVPIPIGRVDDVVDDPEQPELQILHVKPDADLSALRRVYIVYPLPGGREPS